MTMTLVRGNYDDRAGDLPSEAGFEVVDAPLLLGHLRSSVATA